MSETQNEQIQVTLTPEQYGRLMLLAGLREVDYVKPEDRELRTIMAQAASA